MASSDSNIEDVTFYYRRGAECLARGDAEGAVLHLHRATELTPSYAWAHQNLAQAYRALGQAAAAERAYRRALALDPNYVAALTNLATLLGEDGRFAEAVELLQRAVALAPKEAVVRQAYAMALRARAGELFDCADYPGAAKHAARACDVIAPDADALVLLGESLQRSFSFEQAIEVFRQALRLDPDSARVLTGLGRALYGATRLSAATSTLERAITLDAEDAAAHSALGVVYQEQGRIDDAIACFRRALALDPEFHTAHSNLLFTLCFKPDADPAAVYAEHRAFDTRFAAALRDPVAHTNTRDPGRRLKIGYVSPFFSRSAGGYPLLAPIEGHDRGAFEVYCYSVNRFDDEVTARFRQAAEHWIDARAWSDEMLARRIREDGVDILVDGAGHMAGNRLLVFARKPAPIQVSFPTYPNTTGLSAMDYRIVDRHFAPSAVDAWHSERLVRLPDTHIYYEPHGGHDAPDAMPPARRHGYVTFGSFNNLAKLNDATLSLWARLLERLPSARLTLKWKGLDEPAEGLGARLVNAGFDLRRVTLLGWAADTYEPYRQIDICLDPLYANGGTTTCDALWMGVPVVTQYSRTPFSRVGLSHLTNVGLAELAAADDASYLAIAADLANDLSRLTAVRRGLRERFAASALMDRARYARQLEAAYRETWRQWCAAS